MHGDVNWERKFKSNDIINGIARIDIFGSNGVLLVKKGTRIREVHYQRMRDDGLIQSRDGDSKKLQNKLSPHYSPPDSVHSRLYRLINTFSVLQKAIVEDPGPDLRPDLDYVRDSLQALGDENINQILGELYLENSSHYAWIKPLYIGASLNELIKRYNEFRPQQAINPDLAHQLLNAALLHNLGLVISHFDVYQNNRRLDPAQRAEIRARYPQVSAEIAKKLGINDAATLNAIQCHNVDSKDAAFEAQLLRTPMVYAGIALREQTNHSVCDLINPTQEFARLFSEKKLDPILGGLFLKINGLAPIGSILQFDSWEKALIVKGPDETNIASSVLRMITNRSGVQLARPGNPFLLNQTPLEQNGIADHHQFAWNKFPPFAVWEK